MAVSTLLGLFLPPAPPSARVVSIGEMTLTESELTINDSATKSVIVEARHVPLGTPIELEISQKMEPKPPSPSVHSKEVLNSREPPLR